MFNRINLDNWTNLPARLRLRFADDAAAGAAGTPDAAAQAAASTAAQQAAVAAQQTTDAAVAATKAATDAAAGAAAGTAAWDGKIESLDPAAQKIITDLRTEAAGHRTGKTAAETKLAAVLKAAGIDTAEADPVEVARVATDTATKATRELAVFKAASLAGADPVKLLDRTSFTASISGIDPADGPALAAAINAAVLADATLKAARAAGASSVETSGGTGELGQITEAQLAQMTPEQISDAYEKGLLKSLL